MSELLEKAIWIKRYEALQAEIRKWRAMYNAVCNDPRNKKYCPRCGESKLISEFSKDITHKTGHGCYCLTCKKDYGREASHKNGTFRPHEETRDCTLFLGVHVAERVLANYFDGIKRLPTNNPGYDFICKNGYKIDVKSSCRRINPAKNGSDYWKFDTDKNQIADYFLCIGFDNRESLTPEHIWLIPSTMIATRRTMTVVESKLSKWSEFEKDIEKAKTGCDVLRKGDTNEPM